MKKLFCVEPEGLRSISRASTPPQAALGVRARCRGFAVVQGHITTKREGLRRARLKHVLYSFLAVLLPWRGLTSGSVQTPGLAATVALPTVFSTLYPRRSTVFEVYPLALLTSLLEPDSPTDLGNTFRRSFLLNSLE